MPKVALLMLVAALSVAAAMGGCASGPSPTGGYGLTLQVADAPKSRLVIYEITSAGVMTYRAGRTALAGEAGADAGTWRGTLTEADFAPIRALMDANPDPEAATGEPKTPVFRLQMFRSSLGLPETLTSDGPTPFLRDLWTALDALQRRKRPEKFGG
ncbi:MAG: hypothetical protein JNJ48_03795 [Phycisphaerae bacterium]|nr:hypothetical protein [Phycisphaerae bacterium]